MKGTYDAASSDTRPAQHIGADRHGQSKLALSTQQLLQITLSDVLPRISTDDLHALFAPLISGAQPQITFETVFRTGDGTEFPARAQVQYFGDETPPILALIVEEVANQKRIDSDAT